MYNIFTDKSELFECTIKLEGASIKNAIARIIIESEEYNLLFIGEIDSNGNCKIPIKKIKNILPEGTTGNMKLEVIAEDTHFVPWTSPFTVKASKTIQVEVKAQSTEIVEAKKISVNVKQPIKEKKIEPVKKLSEEELLKMLVTSLKKNKATYSDLKENKKIKNIVTNFMNENKIKNKVNFVRELKNRLK